MDERMRRQCSATEALDLGWGGVSVVAVATGLARNTVMAGVREVKHRRRYPRTRVGERIRRAGGGRKPLTQTDPGLTTALQALADELDLTMQVCHFPPGTSKWNKIDHWIPAHRRKIHQARLLTWPCQQSG